MVDEQFASEHGLNMAIEIVDLPSNSMVMFHSFLYVYQRGDHQLVGD